ncbi:MAG TPA: DUF2061 domain-containing protein [Flavobacteriales bacterium]
MGDWRDHGRSVLKGITWRVVGTLDTILLAWLFTGDTTKALTIGAVEVFTKIFLYYLHERLWSRSYLWRDITGEAHRRSLIKGVSWRICGTLDTIIIAFFVTGRYDAAFSIGFMEVFTKVGLFYLHERLWLRFTSSPPKSEQQGDLRVGELDVAETVPLNDAPNGAAFVEADEPVLTEA